MTIREKIINLSLVGALALSMGLGVSIKQVRTNAFERGRQAGQVQATSNLVNAVKDLTTFSTDCLNYRAKQTEKGINGMYNSTNKDEMVGTQRGLSSGRYFMGLIEHAMERYSAKMARGETTVTNEFDWLMKDEDAERKLRVGKIGW
jgi:hypothetical protein